MEIVGLKIASVVAVAVTGIVGGLLPHRLGALKDGQRLLGWGNAFSGGVFLGAALLHLLPDSVSQFVEAGALGEYPFGLMLSGAGFLGILILEKVVLQGRELEDLEPGLGGASWVLFLVLSVHSLIAGAALGLETEAVASVAILVAVLAHKGFAAFALGSRLTADRTAVPRIVATIVLFSVMTPAGIALGTVTSGFLRGPRANLIEAVFDGLAAGTFLYVATLEILEETFAELEDPRHKSAFAILGFAGMAVLALFT